MSDRGKTNCMPNCDELTLSRAALSDAASCLALRAAVAADLERKGTPELCLARESVEEFSAFFNDAESCAYLLRAPSGALAAFGIATYRGASREAFRAFVPDFERSAHNVGYVKLIQVAPEFRGRGLQRKLFAVLETWLAESGSRFACGTVSPDNVPSLINFLRCGYKIKDLHYVKPEGYARLSMLKELPDA